MKCRRPRFDPWIRKIPCRREWQPIPVFLSGEFHGHGSLAGCSPRGCKESDVTEQLTHTQYRTAPWKCKTSQILLLNLCLLKNLENYTKLYSMMKYENTYISLNHMKLPSSGSKMVDYWQLHVSPPATLNGFKRTPELRKFIMKNAQNKRLQAFYSISIIWVYPQNLFSMADF